MVSQELEPLYHRFHTLFPLIKERVLFKTFQVVRTVLLMSLIRTFDCYRDVPLTFKLWGSLVAEWRWQIFYDGSLLKIGLALADYIVLFIGLLLLVAVSLAQRKAPVRERLYQKPYWLKFALWSGLFLLVLIFGAYGIGYDVTQFIYNQF
jgi:hypothetical protein